jgi:hypothetical protein
VKNFHPKNPEMPYRLKKAYLSKLRRYADQFQRDLKIAIYWPQWKNMWTMVSVDKFLLHGTHRCISFPEAMRANEMSLLGDCMIATTPPLGLRFYTDPDNPRTVEVDGSVACRFKRGTLYCGEQEIEDPFEESLAWFFINYGNWVEDKAPAVIQEGQLISFEIPFIPEERDNPDQRADRIDSSIFTRADPYPALCCRPHVRELSGNSACGLSVERMGRPMLNDLGKIELHLETVEQAIGLVESQSFRAGVS